jgi:hypothetical protein
MAWTTRYCRADAAGGGDGTTNTNSGANGAWNTTEAMTNLAPGMQLWMVAAGGTFNLTTTTLTPGAAGTHSSPIVIRGCNATPNDLTLDDSDNSPAMPLLSFTSGGISITGTFILLQKLSLTATTRASALVTSNTEGNQVLACRVVNSFNNSGARAISIQSSAIQFRVRRCYLEAHTGAAFVVELANAHCDISECRIVGGVAGVQPQGGTSIRQITGNIIQGYLTNGISCLADARADIRNNTIHGSSATNGILIAAQSAGTGFTTVTGNLFSGTLTNGVNYAGSPSTLRVRCFGNQYGPSVTNKRVGIVEDENWYDINLVDDPHIDSATNDFRLDPESDAYGTGYPQYFESLTYNTQNAAGPISAAVTVVALSEAVIDQIAAEAATASAAAILLTPANKLATNASGDVSLESADQTAIATAAAAAILVTPANKLATTASGEVTAESVTNPVDVNLPPIIPADVVSVDGVPLITHLAGAMPADQRAFAGFSETGFDALVVSGTTTSCVLSATGLPAGFDPASPPRPVKFLDGTAVSEVAMVTDWDSGTLTLSYTAIGTAPSANSHIKLGPPQKIDGLGLAAAGLDQIVVETGINARQALAPILAVSAGVLSGATSPSISIMAGGNPATTRITASVDGNGNRNAVTLNLPS